MDVRGIPYALAEPYAAPAPWRGEGRALTLDVWSPDPAASLPVMVWIHGGAYAIGRGDLPEYDGARLAADGVVVVTFTYRVGVEGFLQVAGAPPNRGLLDQVAALEWVRENIARYGGDPARVTVFGQSAGAGSIACLLAMPRADGLFARAIAQSVPGTLFTPELAADIAAAATALGEDPELVELVMAEMDRPARWGWAASRSILFAPVVDGEVLPCSPWESRREIDLLVGHTRDEYRLWRALEQPTDLDVGALAPRPYPAADPYELYERILGDWLFRMPSLHLGGTWFYELTWGGALGACHGLDVPLVFGNLTAGAPAGLIDDVDAAETVSAQMRAAWVAFATTGDPGWPRFDTDLVRIFDVEPAVVPYPETESRRIWRDHRFLPHRLAQDGA